MVFLWSNPTRDAKCIFINFVHVIKSIRNTLTTACNARQPMIFVYYMHGNAVSTYDNANATQA
jgi:hypothetical protein